MTAPNAPASSPPDNALGWSILIVDDEPMIRRVAELSLKGEGCRVAQAATAGAAVAAVRAASPPFDLVILDVTLPDGDGTAVVPIIRQSAPATRILIVS
jgi:DNA-binding response OmpR family regulator